MHPLVSLHGSTLPLPERTALRAGELNLIYESGFLRYIKAGDTEIVRLINHYIRDTSWANVPMTILSESIKKNETSFSIEYEALCQDGDIQFRWNCSIHGQPDSSITFEIEGEALTTFKKNRLGFTVLHATTACAGKNCTIIHSDKSREVVTFPENIEPFQPFFDVTGMHWQAAPGVDAILEFEDEIFEPEDQRNWGDASYKTYGTPLARSFPATVTKGDVIRQGIYLKVNTVSPIIHTDEKPLVVTFADEVTSPFPKAGVVLNDLPFREYTKQHIGDLGIDFLRIDIHAGESRISEKFATALHFKLPLDVALFIDQDSSLDFIEQLTPYTPYIRQFMIFPQKSVSTDRALIERVAPLLRTKFPTTRIGGGSNTFFTELNRQPTPIDQLDFLCFPFTPQAHAADMLTMTENLATLPDSIRSCRSIADGRKIHVGPVSLKTRWGGDPGKEKSGGPWKLPASVDPRQLSLYAAAWTMGCFKSLAESGADEVTFYETSGWRGLLSHPDQGWPADFLAPSQTVYPVYLILREILRHKHEQVLKVFSNDPLRVEGLAFRNDKGKKLLLLANLTGKDQVVTISPRVAFTKSWALQESNIMEAIAEPGTQDWMAFEMTDTVRLTPFSIVVLDQ